MTSVSVSDAMVRPRCASACRSSRKFSMIPLWITTTLPARCGCAFCSDGLPCVAQRVCPTPGEPGNGCSRSMASRLSSFPTQRRT
jgi:hypothetical protein